MICGPVVFVPYLTPDCTQMRIKLKSVYQIWWQQSVLSQLQFCLGQSTQKWNPAIIHSPSCHSKSVWLSLSFIVFYIRKTYFENVTFIAWTKTVWISVWFSFVCGTHKKMLWKISQLCFLCSYNDSQNVHMLFWIPLIFIIWTKNPL